MDRIGLVSNYDKRQALELADDTARMLSDWGLEILFEKGTARLLHRKQRGYVLGDLGERADMIIAFGGDGTLLKTARELSGTERPVLGVNVGNLGFLSELETDELQTGLRQILDGDFEVEDRMMLRADVLREGREGGGDRFIALNDVVITKGAFSRLVRLDVYVEDRYLDTYLSDGMIVSTPTGSTAYSLSAGGPIISPGLELMLITPICPHTFSSRSIAIPPQQQVRISLRGQAQEVILTVDGQQGLKLDPEDRINVRASSRRARFIRLKKRSFYDAIRLRLQQRDCCKRMGQESEAGKRGDGG